MTDLDIYLKIKPRMTSHIRSQVFFFLEFKSKFFTVEQTKIYVRIFLALSIVFTTLKGHYV